MKDIKTILANLGIELTEEQTATLKKEVNENYKTITEFTKKIETVTSEKELLQQQYDEAKASLEKFGDVDVEDLKTQIQEAQKKIKETEENAKKQIAERDYMDAIKTQTESLKFSSNSAKKSFINDLKDKGLKLENGKILGFDDFVNEYKETDAEAFVSEEVEEKARFTDTVNIDKTGQGINATVEAAKLRAAFGLPEESK